MRRGRVAGDGFAQAADISIAGYRPSTGVGPFKSPEFIEPNGTSPNPTRHLYSIGQLKKVAAHNLGNTYGREPWPELLESLSFLANAGLILAGCDIAVQFTLLMQMLHLRPPSMMRTWSSGLNQ